MARNFRIALAQVAVGPEREDNVVKALRMMADAVGGRGTAHCLPRDERRPLFPPVPRRAALL